MFIATRRTAHNNFMCLIKVKYVIVWLLALRSIYSTVMMSYDVEKLDGYIV